jgi:hypothetical protein
MCTGGIIQCRGGIKLQYSVCGRLSRSTGLLLLNGPAPSPLLTIGSDHGLEGNLLPSSGMGSLPLKLTITGLFFFDRKTMNMMIN